MKMTPLTLGMAAAFLTASLQPLPAQTNGEPVVTVRAEDPLASETGPDPGVFIVRRAGSTNLPLIVFLHVTGTASNGVDYLALSNTVFLAAGVSSAVIPVTPIDDHLIESHETVVLQITPSPLACASCSYQIGVPSNAVVTIADNDLPPPTNQPPSVVINSPRDGDVFIAPATVVLQAFAQDTEDGFDLEVEFFAGDHSLGLGTFVPTLCPSPFCPFFTLAWSNAPVGDYVLTARATDHNGASNTSHPVRISITDHPPTTNTPPRIRIVRLTDGELFAPHSDIRLVAFAQDAEDGYSVQVEFFAGDHRLGAGEFNPTRCAPDCPNYVFIWSNAPSGLFTLTAQATDSGGAVGVSEPVRILVLETNVPPDTNAPVVTIVARDAVAVEGPFCLSNWWWTTSWDANGWVISPSVVPPANHCDGTNTATFVLHRTGPTNSALTVLYGVSGTALNGTDYLPLPGSFTFAPGRRSGQIEVVPLEDALVEGTETVVLSLQPAPAQPDGSDGYLIGHPHRAAALIVDNDRPRPPCRRLPDGLFHVCHPGTNGYVFVLEASRDLANWDVLCTNVVTDGAVHFVDPDALDFGSRFYRVSSSPDPLTGE